MRLTALLPLACAIVAFIMSMLCLFAGSKPGFLEDYHIITLNTSTLGHNLLPTETSNDGPSPTVTSVGSFFSDLADDVQDKVSDKLNNLTNSIADKLADKLGINEWYSLHLMDMCYGSFKPNTTAPGATKNVSECTNATAMFHFDLTKQINQELEVGPLELNLSDIKWPEQIQDGLDSLNMAMDATFVLYCIGIAAAGLAIFTSILAIFSNGSRLVSLVNWAIAGLSFLTLLIASIIVTVAQDKAAGYINKYGNDVGAYAYKGGKYLVLTWVPVGVMLVATLAWTGEFCLGKRKTKREFTEKSTAHRGGFAGWRHRRSDEHALRRSGV